MEPDTRVSILLAVAAADVVLLTFLSSRRGRFSCAKHGRFFLWAASALYFSLISYILTYVTNNLSFLANQSSPDRRHPLAPVIIITAFVQSLKSNADIAALAVAAVASPAAGADDLDSQKMRPSMDSLVYSFWVAGFTVYTVLLQEGRRRPMEDEVVVVPRLILTGERNKDVEESLQGYRVKRSVLEDGSSSLVTLDKVWSSRDHRLSPELKDLCLSFCLFKCLRRRFAGYRLAESGSVWAFRFGCDGLLVQEGDPERMFRVIAHELSFASDFYYSPLPVASLGAWPAAPHFIISLLIGAPLFIMYILAFLLSSIFALSLAHGSYPLKLLSDKEPNGSHPWAFSSALILIATVGASIEIWAMVTSVHSNWTKISMVAHCINRSCWSQMISSCLLRCESPRHWKDVIGQSLLLNPIPPNHKHHLFKRIFHPRRNQHVKITPDVKAAIIRSLRVSEQRLSNGIATVQRRCPDLSWACRGDITTSTDVILVWHIATSLFECSPAASPAPKSTTNMDIANNLSRYCVYLVAEAPDLLPDNVAWTKLRYRQVKEYVETSMRSAGSWSDLYWHLVETFGHDNSHEVVKMGLRLGRQLVQEVQMQSEENQGQNLEESAKAEEAMWKLLAEFWSEMVLYLAPSDYVKGHIETLQRGGELITLLWALLLHAGITARPAYNVPEEP